MKFKLVVFSVCSSWKCSEYDKSENKKLLNSTVVRIKEGVTDALMVSKLQKNFSRIKKGTKIE